MHPIGKDINKASEIIRNGGIVVYPTETVYGIGANIFRSDALEKVFIIKGRDAQKPISIAVSSYRMMNDLIHMDEKQRKFIDMFLPGPVTFLLEKKETVPDILTPGTNLVGIRYPNHEIAIKLIEMAGVPITSTSANISGEPAPTRIEEIKIDPDYILDGGECVGRPSTVVDLVNLKILRKGERCEEVRAALENYGKT